MCPFNIEVNNYAADTTFELLLAHICAYFRHDMHAMG